MKKAIVCVEVCEACPYVDFDDQSDPNKYGKYWCTILDKDVDPFDIDTDCELDDE